jgi:uncharacterized protein
MSFRFAVRRFTLGAAAYGLTDPEAGHRLLRPAKPVAAETFGCMRREATMSEQDQNIEVVKKGYDAFSKGDIETVLSVYDDKIEWVQPGDSDISGTYRGKRELGDYLRRLGEKSTVVKPHRFLADGDTVVVLSKDTVGGETSQDALVFALRGGKVVRAHLYADTAVMERVFGKKKAAASKKKAAAR